uniref:CPXV211 protein n=1 Tax=Strongyloides venezuelensis TaxID=75913 RepID=A0A0K0FTN1_STRVS
MSLQRSKIWGKKGTKIWYFVPLSRCISRTTYHIKKTKITKITTIKEPKSTKKPKSTTTTTTLTSTSTTLITIISPKTIIPTTTYECIDSSENSSDGILDSIESSSEEEYDYNDYDQGNTDSHSGLLYK